MTIRTALQLFPTSVFVLATATAFSFLAGCDGLEDSEDASCQSRAWASRLEKPVTTGNVVGKGIVGAEAPLSSRDVRWSSTVLFDLVKGDMRYTCSGVLVAPNLVLSAGHCFSDYAFESATFGENEASNLKVKIQEFKLHPNYRGVGYHDIAWVKLARNAPSSASIVTVLRDPSLVTQGMPVTLVGYGVTGTKNNDSGTKRQTSSFLQAYRKNTVLDGRTLLNSFVVGQTQYKGSCFGDSGGPAFVTISGNTYAIGTTSGSTAVSTIEDHCERGLAVWTAIGEYTDWIQKSSGVKLATSNEPAGSRSSDDAAACFASL